MVTLTRLFSSPRKSGTVVTLNNCSWIGTFSSSEELSSSLESNVHESQSWHEIYCTDRAYLALFEENIKRGGEGTLKGKKKMRPAL